MNTQFKTGDWIVNQLSFGARIIQMQFNGFFDSTHLRHATPEDFFNIPSSVWEDGKKIYEGTFPYQGFTHPNEMIQ